MVEELKKLEDNTRQAVSRVAAEYKYAVEFKNELEKIEHEQDPGRAIKEVRNGLRVLRWVGRAEGRVNQSEKKILSNLEDLGKILPADLKTREVDLHEKLTVAERKLVELASMFTGKVKTELQDIKTDEALLKRYEKDPEKAKHIHNNLTKLFKDAEAHITELITWIGGTEAILKQIEGFEETIKELSA